LRRKGKGPEVSPQTTLETGKFHIFLRSLASLFAEIHGVPGGLDRRKGEKEKVGIVLTCVPVSGTSGGTWLDGEANQNFANFLRFRTEGESLEGGIRVQGRKAQALSREDLKKEGEKVRGKGFRDPARFGREIFSA